MIIRTAGAVVGQVVQVRDHSGAQKIWLALVNLGCRKSPVQIVFGGQHKVSEGDLVPVAPPGALVTFRPLVFSIPTTKKMRKRKFRGESSHGMLCSLNELGWASHGPDEVAVLCNLRSGDSLDDIAIDRRAEFVLRHRETLKSAIEAEVDEVLGSLHPEDVPAQTTPAES